MRAYIATALTRWADHNAVRDALAARDVALTYDWTAQGGDHGDMRMYGTDTLRAVAAAELRGVRDADVVVVLLPGGRGTHAELGAALALEKPVLIAGAREALRDAEGRLCAFYCAPTAAWLVGPFHAGDVADVAVRHARGFAKAPNAIRDPDEAQKLLR